ncbi:MAG: type II toxin-antitoxin system VapC family toxin [PVC group bacterium]
MELLQGARNRQEVKNIKSLLIEFNLEIVPLSENTGHRASIYMEEYGLKTTICLADVLIAATAVEDGFILCTGNVKHYRPIKDLTIKPFRP